MTPATFGPFHATGTEEISYPQIDRRAGLSLKQFHRDYRSTGKPVVILDAIDDWQARKTWTFEFFASRYGSDSVQTYCYKGDKYKPQDAVQMSLAKYIQGVTTSDWKSFPYYIRDNWALLIAHPELAADYRYPKYFYDWFALLPSFMRLRYPRIFIGPKGAVTPLHVDIWGTHAWLSQLVGRKRWILFPPDQASLLYNYTVDPDRPDFERFPLYRNARPVECTIGPGETIFVPGGWAHWVVSLDATISLSANYMGPGAFWSPLTNATRELAWKRFWSSIRKPATPTAGTATRG
jgi:ribosomal protein L16 Arg81 hydroxylase